MRCGGEARGLGLLRRPAERGPSTAAPFQERLADRTGGRLGREEGRRPSPARAAAPRAVELLVDLGLAAPELLHVLAGGGDLLAAELLPLVDRGLLDPVDVERDPADGDVAQEQAGRQPEQARPERRERPGIDQARVAAEVVDPVEGARQVDPAVGQDLPGDDLAVGQLARVSSVVGFDRSSRYSSE